MRPGISAQSQETRQTRAGMFGEVEAKGPGCRLTWLPFAFSAEIDDRLFD